uniref:Uncharacterized protein LOC104239325 n=1 Tax=Nicotiana sylvestris TaxID=4096 RepID=A0A1U7XMW6_NICSY|nr:PREDICTED: uncharacterized protein LOC104239325 [Nicotiana sylvestris]
MGQSSNPHQVQSMDSLSSRAFVESVHPTPETENSGAGNLCENREIKKGRWRYKSLHVDMKTKYGSKIPIIIPDDIVRAVGPGSRDIVNYCGLIMRSTISFRDGDWKAIIAKHGEVMWLKVKDKFEASGMREHVLQALVVDTMQRLFRAWKTRLHKEYNLYTTDKERLSHRPDDVTP